MSERLLQTSRDTRNPATQVATQAVYQQQCKHELEGATPDDPQVEIYPCEFCVVHLRPSSEANTSSSSRLLGLMMSMYGSDFCSPSCNLVLH